jgi:hypothetical protein
MSADLTFLTQWTGNGESRLECFQVKWPRFTDWKHDEIESPCIPLSFSRAV